MSSMHGHWLADDPARAGEQNRARFDLQHVFPVTLAGPPGCGKTALASAVAGVLSTSATVRRVQLTGPRPSAAAQVGRLLSASLRGLDFLLVESDLEAGPSVGGQACVRVASVFEPVPSFAAPFGRVDALVVTQLDRHEEAGFDASGFARALGVTHPNLLVFLTSSVDGRGVRPFAEWLLRRRDAHFYRTAASSARLRQAAFA